MRPHGEDPRHPRPPAPAVDGRQLGRVLLGAVGVGAPELRQRALGAQLRVRHLPPPPPSVALVPSLFVVFLPLPPFLPSSAADEED